MIIWRTREVAAMRLESLVRRIRERQGQNLIEYALVAAIVSAAIVAMSTYVFRSVQATQQMIHKEFRTQ